MRNPSRLSRSSKILRRGQVKLDNLALVPGNLLPYKRQYQEIANGLSKGDILIVLPAEVQKRGTFEKTAAQLKNKGRRIATISAARFVP
jgi:hypothetical protein